MNFRSTGKWIFQDIRIWIFSVFIFQLIFITQPPLEPAHAWRQSLTNMMARNFVQENASFFLPEIDIAGEHEGVIASELPVLQYIMSIFYRLFPWREEVRAYRAAQQIIRAKHHLRIGSGSCAR